MPIKALKYWEGMGSATSAWSRMPGICPGRRGSSSKQDSLWFLPPPHIPPVTGPIYSHFFPRLRPCKKAACSSMKSSACSGIGSYSLPLNLRSSTSPMQTAIAQVMCSPGWRGLKYRFEFYRKERHEGAYRMEGRSKFSCQVRQWPRRTDGWTSGSRGAKPRAKADGNAFDGDRRERGV